MSILENTKTKKRKQLEKDIKKNPIFQAKKNFDKRKTNTKAEYRLILDSMRSGIEADYFWILRFMKSISYFGLRMDGEEGEVLKLRDLYGAAESSSYWGNIEQRRTTQVEKFGQTMQIISGMIKSTFQILRELRIIEERMEYYKDYDKGDQAGAVALKSVWVDMVEGGSKNPGSVYGLSTQVGFTILPDLFFKFSPKNSQEVDKILKGLEKEHINRKIREVLGRKLKQFIIWKEKTQKEISVRETFMLRYLRQHFNSIKLQINWIRPFLKNIKQLEFSDWRNDPDLLKSIETAKTEVELLGINFQYIEKNPETDFETIKEFQEYYPCVLVRMSFVVLPQMSFQKEYSRGAMQTGRTLIRIGPCVATAQDIKDYRDYQDEEDIDLIASLDSSLDAMKEDLNHFLEKAGEQSVIDAKKQEEEEKQSMHEGILEPFKAIGSGFKEMFAVFSSKKQEETKTKYKLSAKLAEEEKRKAKSIASGKAFTVYHVFKKAHGMIAP